MAQVEKGHQGRNQALVSTIHEAPFSYYFGICNLLGIASVVPINGL
jgi:hypothetical protein